MGTLSVSNFSDDQLQELRVRKAKQGYNSWGAMIVDEFDLSRRKDE
jgi:hypothetical protein